MTFEQAQDQLAKSYGWSSINDLCANESLNTSIEVLKEAAELYAKSEIELEKARLVDSLQDLIKQTLLVRKPELSN